MAASMSELIENALDDCMPSDVCASLGLPQETTFRAAIARSVVAKALRGDYSMCKFLFELSGVRVDDDDEIDGLSRALYEFAQEMDSSSETSESV